MANLIQEILDASKVGDCLGISGTEPSIFPGTPGFGPVLKGFIGASLGPYEPLTKIIDPNTIIPIDPTKLLEFPKKLTELIKPDGLGALIALGFNSNAEGMPDIPVKIPGIPGSLTVGGGGTPFDPLQVPALIDFFVGLLTIPFKLITDIIIGPLIELKLPAPTLEGLKDLLGSALSAISFPEGLVEKFAGCLLKALIGVVNAFLKLFKIPGLPI